MGIVLLPLQMLWSLIGFLLGLTGRLVLGIIGLVLIIAGLVLTVTVIGAVTGIPLAIAGVLLLLGSIF